MRKVNEYDRFPIAKRGYDPRAVEAFLDVVAADNDRTLNEAAGRIAALEADLEEAKRQEEAVHLTILAATKTKDDIIEAARHQAGEIVADGGKEGDRIVTDARMQAFQLVTGARKEAETIVGEARVEAAAVARADGVPEIPADGPNEHEQALQGRINELQQVIAAMELELSNRPTIEKTVSPTTAPNSTEETPVPTTEVSNMPSTPAPDLDVAPASSPAEAHDEHVADEHIAIVVTDEPSVESPTGRAEAETEIAVDDVAVTVEADAESPEPVASTPSDGSITDERTPEAVRRSFYSRRSAKLPRIGKEGGRGTMAAIAGLRTNFVTADSAAEVDSEGDPAFEAV